MIGTDRPFGPQLVSVAGKEEREDSEEESGYFKPQHTARMGKGFPHRFAEFARPLDDSFSFSGVNLWLRDLLRFACRRRAALGGALKNHFRGDTHTNSESAAERIRLHINKSLAACLIPIALLGHQK